MSLPSLIRSYFRWLVILFFVVGGLLFSPTTPLASAQTISNSNSATAPDVVDNSHTRMQIQLIEFSSALICQLVGIDVISPTKGCLGINPVTEKIGYAQSPQHPTQLGGLMGMVVGGISSTYQPVVTTTQFTNYLAGNFGIIKPIQAQEGNSGSFGGFTFLQELFITLRNLTFSLFVVLFILIGIAIMLRVKIDPRTVMSIQNQIPKIVISIIMITFSYAIAGLLTDGMWVITFLGINTVGEIAQQECKATSSGDNTIVGVASQSLYNSPILYVHNIFNTNSCFGNDTGHWSGLWGLSRQVGSSLGDILTSTIIQGLGGDLTELAQTQNECSFVHSLTHPVDCAKNAAFGVISGVIGIIALLIVLIAVLLALVRVWFTLIKAYVYIILDVVSAPIQIGAGLLPGSTWGFQRWFRHITAYLLVFPAVAIILVLAAVFALNPAINDAQGQAALSIFLPPFVGNPFMQNNLGALIAFGLILITPELLEMIKDALKVKGSDKATKAIIGGFSRGVAPTQSLGGIGGELFGKDKSGNPRALRRIVGNKWAQKTRPNTLLGGAKYSPVRIWRRSQQSQDLTRRENLSRQSTYALDQAQHAYDEHYLRYGDHGAALKHAEPILARAFITPGTDSYRRFVQMTRGYRGEEISTPGKEAAKTSTQTTSQTASPAGKAAAAATATATATATAGSAAASHAPNTGGHAGGGVTTTTPPTTPQIELHRDGNDLKKPDGTVVLTFKDSDRSFTSVEDHGTWNMWQLTGWLTRHGYKYTT